MMTTPLALRRLFSAGLLLSLGACAPARVAPQAPPAGDPAASSAAAEAATPAVRDARELIRQLQSEFVPDRRVARFDVEVEAAGEGVLLRGETTLPEAHSRLAQLLTDRGIPARDEVLLLPDASLGERNWALINNSVANLRSEPAHAAEMATQALLGTPVRLLKRRGGFFLVQVPDGYIAWATDDELQPLSAAEVQAYEQAPKVIYLQVAGSAYAEPRREAGRVADVVAGDLLVLEGERDGFAQVRFPDGREGYLPLEETQRFDAWLASLAPSETSLVAEAERLLGAPYLWGGTSTKGMDCSGFTKTVYLMNGIILPRDASQQVHSGVLVDDGGDFSRLRPGDLLFFGTPATAATPERVVHVGMWIGDGRFIHSSGRVRVSSVDPSAADFDEFNRRRYLRTKRILPSLEGVTLLRNGGLYRF